jgi:acyl carrier protein
MMTDTKNPEFFLELIKKQFSDEARASITDETDLRSLKEWSSLQTMIIVNEIDKEYNVILGFEDLKKASSVSQLFKIIQNKIG